MKVTVELKDEDRSRLLQLAAQDPDKDLARLVAEAIQFFLDSHSLESSRKERVEALRGCLSEEEAKAFSEALGRIRSSWR